MQTIRSWRSLGLLIALSLIWATLFVAVKIGDHYDAPMTLMFDRACVATLCLLPFAIANYRKYIRTGKSIRLSQLCCCLFVGFGIAYMWLMIAVSEVVITSGAASLLTSSIYVFSWLISVCVIRSKRFHSIHAIGVIIASIGLACAIGINHLVTHHTQLYAILQFLSGFLAFAIASLLSKKYTSDVPAMIVTTINIFFTTVFLALGGIFHILPWQQSYELTPILSILWAGMICTAVGYLLYYQLISSDGPLFANYFGYLVPIFGLLLGVTLMGNKITWLQITGIPILLYGIYLTHVKPAIE